MKQSLHHKVCIRTTKCLAVQQVHSFFNPVIIYQIMPEGHYQAADLLPIFGHERVKLALFAQSKQLYFFYNGKLLKCK